MNTLAHRQQRTKAPKPLKTTRAPRAGLAARQSTKTTMLNKARPTVSSRAVRSDVQLNELVTNGRGREHAEVCHEQRYVLRRRVVAAGVVDGHAARQQGAHVHGLVLHRQVLGGGRVGLQGGERGLRVGG